MIITWKALGWTVRFPLYWWSQLATVWRLPLVEGSPALGMWWAESCVSNASQQRLNQTDPTAAAHFKKSCSSWFQSPPLSPPPRRRILAGWTHLRAFQDVSRSIQTGNQRLPSAGSWQSHSTTLFASFRSHQPIIGVGMAVRGGWHFFQCDPFIRQQHWKRKIINIVLGGRKEQLSSCKPKDAVKNMFFCLFSRKQEKRRFSF